MCLFSWLALSRGGELWNGADVSRRNVYCETVVWSRALRQRVNTVSNLPFALSGAHLLSLGGADLAGARRRPPGAALQSQLQRFPSFSLLSGVSHLWIAAGSSLFHASWSRAGQRADMGAVYAALLCPSLFLLLRLGLLGPRRAGGERGFQLACLAAWTAGLVYKWRLKSSSLVPQLLALLLSLLLLWLLLGSPEAEAEAAAEDCGGGGGGGGVTAAALRRWWLGPVRRLPPAGLCWPVLAGAAGAGVVAFAATLEDMRRASRLGCDGGGLWQLHSLWHLAAAAALWLLYLFFRSEAPVEAEASGAA